MTSGGEDGESTWLQRHWFHLLVVCPWVVFTAVWFVPLTADQVQFGRGVIAVADCPAPYYYATHDSGFARDCNLLAFDRVMAFGLFALFFSAGCVLIRAFARDLRRRQARASPNTEI